MRSHAESLKKRSEMCGQPDFLKLPYLQGIRKNELPLSIGGIDQSRTYMLLLRKTHLGEVSVTVWPRIPEDKRRKYDISSIE